MSQAKPAQKPIWLVGMMGCGKSTVGPVLAGLLDREFVDNDRRIEEREGRTIAAIFDGEGEPAFRALEARSIEDVARRSAVVALGGGAIAQPGAPERLAALGTVVYLRASVETLMGRVGNARGRPLLDGLDPEARRERLARMLDERKRAYESAEIVVDTDGCDPERVAERVARELRGGP